MHTRHIVVIKSVFILPFENEHAYFGTFVSDTSHVTAPYKLSFYYYYHYLPRR